MFRSVASLAVLCCFFAGVRLTGQTSVPVSVPAGITVPVMLSTTIRSDKSKAGEAIRARVMQNVPFPGGGRIARGRNLSGHIVEINPTEVTLKFDRLLIDKQEVPLRTSLRAIASMLAVQDAHIPTNSAGDRGNPPSMWNTQQIGGRDVVYGRPGDVLDGSEQVGQSLGDGSIFVTLRENLNGRCEDDSKQLQAVWVFSSSACGAYGFGDLRVDHYGQTDPAGTIVLRSSSRIDIRSGSGLLLRVIGQ
jgi:hypothetical protein